MAAGESSHVVWSGTFPNSEGSWREGTSVPASGQVDCDRIDAASERHCDASELAVHANEGALVLLLSRVVADRIEDRAVGRERLD